MILNKQFKKGELMNNLSLRMKLLSIITPILIILSILGGILVRNNFQRKSEGANLQQHALIFVKLSESIHQLQIERGKSNLFITKKLTKDELEKQQKIGDELFFDVDKKIEGVGNEKLKNGLKEILDLKKTAREEVEKLNTKEAITKFSQAVKKLIDLQVLIMDSASFEGIEGDIKSLTIVEAAKENMGRLRASLNASFGQNLKKELSERDQYSNYLSGIIINLESPGLSISKDSKDKVYGILNSEGWKKVLSDFKVFAEKYQTGEYGVDAKLFTENITLQINAVFEIIKTEQNAQLHNLEDKISDATRMLWLTVVVVLIVVVVAIIFSLVLINGLNKQFNSVVSTLEKSSIELNTASSEIAAASEELSQATTEQAASLQETSASIEEISSMINNTRENALKSESESKKAVATSENGQQVVSEVISAINEIDQSNTSVLNQVTEMNIEIQKILEIINEIATKTKVINDIVFQTKLLSFNASVEAARAAEHGKGFAVVAEEVGNLAAMSGNAALEITTILSASTKTVESIVKTSEIKVQALIDQSKSKINRGIQVARECEDAFTDLNSKILDIAKMSGDISTATNEQTKGVQEVNKAIVQLDQVAQQNSSNANQSSKSAGALANQANLLSNMVNELVKIVNGG